MLPWKSRLVTPFVPLFGFSLGEWVSPGEGGGLQGFGGHTLINPDRFES